MNFLNYGMSEIQIRPIKPLNPSVLLNSFRIIRSGNGSLGKVEYIQQYIAVIILKTYYTINDCLHFACINFYPPPLNTDKQSFVSSCSESHNQSLAANSQQ